LILILNTFNSCEHGYSYNYILTNNTETTMTVYIKTFSNDSTGIFLQKALIISIPPFMECKDLVDLSFQKVNC